MAHRAIVIGVDAYTDQPRLNLKGAVNDALTMAAWLIDGEGGQVPASNVVLLTSPAVNLPASWDGVQTVAPATAKNINRQLKEVPTKSAQPNDRFYFFFAGHGLTAPNDIAEEAILPADYTTDDPSAALGVPSILDWLKTSQYNQQFIFIDACRNTPFEKRFAIGRFPWIPGSSDRRPQVEQFVYMSTSRGLTAAEVTTLESADASRAGVFTSALIDGLRGGGEAKYYNYATKGYDVTADHLLHYLVNRVRKQMAALALPDAVTPAAFLQTPTISGERFSNPVIVSIPSDKVGDVTLTLEVDPSPAWIATTLVIEQGDFEIKRVTPPLTIPHQISLRPKEYSVTANANAYKPEPICQPVPLYSNTSAKFTMTAVEQVATTPPAAQSSGLQQSSGYSLKFDQPAEEQVSLTRSATAGVPSYTVDMGHSGSAVVTASRSVTASAFQAPEPIGDTHPTNSLATLIVQSPDVSSPLEIEYVGNRPTQMGRSLIMAGSQSITAQVAPGLYTARLRAPNGRSVEKLVQLTAGQTQTVELCPPELPSSGSLNKLAEATGFVNNGATIGLSESAGLASLAWVRLSTVLSSAANAQVFPPEALEARRLRSLGLTSLRNMLVNGSQTALQVLLGDELTASKTADSSAGTDSSLILKPVYVDSTRLACWPIDKPAPSSEESPRRTSNFAFISEQSWALKPGCYWLSVRNIDYGRSLFPVIISPERVTNVVFTRNERKKVSIFAYQPSPAGNPQKVMQAERKLEMAQRYFMNGQMSDALLLSQPSLSSASAPEAHQWISEKESDPLSTLLNSYLVLRSMEAEKQKSPVYASKEPALETTSQDLITHYSFFPDTYVIAAEVQVRQGKLDDARRTALQALDAGVPIFEEGLLRLSKLITSFKLQHCRKALIEEVVQHHIPGLIWIIYVPEETPAQN